MAFLFLSIFASFGFVIQMRITTKELLERYEQGERNFSRDDLGVIALNPPWLIDVNLNDINLGRSHIQNGGLINIDLSGANLERSRFTQTLLVKINLSNANLSRANLDRVDFTSANLTGANLTNANLTGANLTGANLIGANLTNIQINERTIFCNTFMPDGSINSSHVKIITAPELLRRYENGERDFRNIIMHGGDLNGADLQSIDLSGAYLSYVNFSNVNFRGSNFLAAKFIFCDFREANINICNFDGIRLIYCDLRGMYGVGVDCTSANYICSNFQGASFNGFGQEPTFLCHVTWCDGVFIDEPTGRLHPNSFFFEEE